MRLNRYIATYSDLSRRKADELILASRVIVDRKPAHVGVDVSHNNSIIVDGKKLIPVKRKSRTVLLYKPEGFVCSRNGQGAPTVYDLLPKGMSRLNIAGRLDKDSSGLVVLTDDGSILQKLTHPSENKQKIYEVTLNTHLSKQHVQQLAQGVNIGDTRLSKLSASPHRGYPNGSTYIVTMSEGRKRQIRRSFEVLGYNVERLHRTQLGSYSLANIPPEGYREV